MKPITLFSLLSLFLLNCFQSSAQDLDQDEINDRLEEALARRFAPEWRFHKTVPGDGSNQNHDEGFFPSSIEWFHNYILQETGQYPDLEHMPTGQKAPITDMSQLSTMEVPGTGRTADDPAWGSCSTKEIRMTNYPEKIPGDPTGFPTYYRCYKLPDGRVYIGYLLFYPYDYKGSYLWGLEFGQHRGDWEGINVLVSGVADLDDPASAENAVLERVKFSAHTTGYYILPNSPRFRSVNGTHPKVYIAWGAHACYPEPGEWHNYKVDFPLDIANVYDDFFHGNGLVVQSWQTGRELINLGEEELPAVGWLNYRGLWGPDDNGQNSSPSGPLCKRVWTASLNGILPWEAALLPENYSAFWKDAFTLDCSPEVGFLYIPDPGYDCDAYVDCRVTCPDDRAPKPTVIEGVFQTQPGGVLGLFPCHYRENLTISKEVTLKAVEGPVLIGN
jgi:hypothetical protein